MTWRYIKMSKFNPTPLFFIFIVVALIIFGIMYYMKNGGF